MNELAFNDYGQFKAEFDREVKQAAESFVRVGFLLKTARDTGILQGSGYTSMGEFAKAEYGLSADQTSRFISVYEKFGDGSGQLKIEYSEFGQTKLMEMLTLPDNIIEEITPDTTREEIRQIKQEIKEEEKISPLEVMMEKAEAPEDFNDIESFLHLYFKDHKDRFIRLSKELQKSAAGEEKDIIISVLVPSGIGILTQRIPGKGKFMLSFRGIDKDIALLNVRDNTKEEFPWDGIIENIENRLMYDGEYGDPEETYSKIYKVAPAQVTESVQTQSPTNFEENTTSPQQVKSEEDRKEPEKGLLKNEEQDFMNPPEVEKVEGEVVESKSPTNIPEDEKSENQTPTNFAESEGTETQSPTNFENSLEDNVDAAILYERAKRASYDLDQELNLFILDMPNLKTADEIEEEMYKITQKMDRWKDIMIKWRQSR